MTPGALQTALGYRFRDPALLTQALTHRSLGASVHNQRLEFLGDAVLGLLIAEMLYTMYPQDQEGDLSKRLVHLVNGDCLTAIARALNLGTALQLSESEAAQGGRENPSNLEDACEALLGALYLDGGLAAVRPLILAHWQPIARELSRAPQDPKTALQEWAQARGLPLPAYQVLSAQGPAHAPHFVVEVLVEGQPPATGESGTKRAAERAAAHALLAQLNAS